jgi:hypothetical protein
LSAASCESHSAFHALRSDNLVGAPRYESLRDFEDAIELKVNRAREVVRRIAMTVVEVAKMERISAREIGLSASTSIACSR